MLKWKTLTEILDYNSSTGLFYWKVASGRVSIGAEAGTNHNAGYRQIRINGKLYLAHRLAWFYVYKEWPTQKVDHINRIKHDNRIINLRCVSDIENAHNSNRPSNNTSGSVGVSYHIKRGHWMARIHVEGKTIYLGTFPSKDSAIQARKQAEKRYGFTNA